MERFLQASAHINFDNPIVAAQAASLALGADTETDLVKRCFYFVRDEIQHSLDFNAPV